jgi:hypothetical protein
MARIVHMSTGPGRWSTHALSLRNFATFRYGQEFYRTAQKTGSPMVRAYLLGHALELFFKSYLMKMGLTTTTLKRKPYSHDLVKLLAAARANNLESIVHVSPELEKSTAELAAVYPETLRYFSLLDLFGPPRLPSLVRLFRFAKALNEGLERHLKIEP